MARRYGCRPSALVCIPPEDPRALALDLRVAMAAAEALHAAGATVFPVAVV